MPVISTSLPRGARGQAVASHKWTARMYGERTRTSVEIDDMMVNEPRRLVGGPALGSWASQAYHLRFQWAFEPTSKDKANRIPGQQGEGIGAEDEEKQVVQLVQQYIPYICLAGLEDKVRGGRTPRGPNVARDAGCSRDTRRVTSRRQ
ncbi:hypothetical protein PG995_002822 [Apiospora arundinis]